MVKARKIWNYVNKFEVDLEEIVQTNWLRKKIYTTQLLGVIC
jgi:hypothetical protein